MVETFHRTRVVTKNVFIDVIQNLRNFLGFRLRGYEDAIEEGAHELIEEVENDYDLTGDDAWFRVETDPMTTGSAIVTVYGQGEPK